MRSFVSWLLLSLGTIVTLPLFIYLMYLGDCFLSGGTLGADWWPISWLPDCAEIAKAFQ